MIGRAGLWLLWIAVLAAAALALAAGGRLQMHSDLLALLPAPQRDPVKAAALDRLAELGRRQVVLLVGTSGAATGNRAADAAAAALSQSRSFSQVVASANDLLTKAQREKLETLLFDHRFHLLARPDAAALARLAKSPADDDSPALAHFMDRARAQLYGLGIGGGAGGNRRFVADPLGLANTYRRGAIANPAPGLRVAADGHFYVVGGQGQRYAVLFAESRQDPFTLSAQSGQLAALSQARSAAGAVAPRAEILVSGVVRHAAAASARARREVAFIGSGSLAGILVLMVWAFGGIRPFVLSLMAIAGGVLLAVDVTAAVFGGIHVLTLVFGASLVGVAVDYCLHFFAQRWHTPQPQRALRRILPAVTLGLLTSVLAYGGMGFAPFPGLRQIAMFAATGLIGAWLGVVLLLPAWAGNPPRSGSALRWARRWQVRGLGRLAAGHWNALLWLMSAAFFLLTIVAYTTLLPDDDIRLLYNPPSGLLHEDMQVAKLLGTSLASRSILVQGDSPADVLRAEAALVQTLATPAKPVADITAITQAYPPAAAQRRYYAELADTLYARAGPVDKLLASVGFKPDALQVQRQAFAAERGRILAFKRWLDSPASAGRRGLWLGRVGNRWASLIRLRQVHDAGALSRIVARHADIQTMDRVAEISGLIGRYRHRTTWLLIAAYALAGLLLCWPFGARGAWAILMPPMLASVIVAVIFAGTGWPFSLFNLLALILLLGLGADYGIFLRLAGVDQAPAMLAVALSAATTLLAFGLLAASTTPALHGFGITLALGLTITFLLASLVGGGGDDGRT